jgi:hypothetical protein
MDICKVTRLECSECTSCCGSKTNKTKMATAILKNATDLIKIVEV